ncbi:hypothetical protein [Microlunatus speluncae]|uniref:hypothetical protein n=1 Tax=Microlunatus speluncae TaxID=2594267 RepID=UPI0012665558|nr:hypothetical protein [Microlunatus speluncae]
MSTHSSPDAVHGTLFHSHLSSPRGDHLLPLNDLRDANPELYTRHAEKYVARPHGLTEPVAPLNCTWGDVVFLAPVHPAPLFEALARSGRAVAPAPPATIDASRLDPSRCVIRLMRHGRDGHHADPPDEHDYLPFNTAGLRAVSRVTQIALDRLERLGPDDPWLPWVDVPHVLHRGPIPLAWFTAPR